MFKKFYLSFIAALISSITVGSAYGTEVPSADEETTPTSETAAVEESTEETTKQAAPEPFLEVPESELIEMVGFLTAQSGGVTVLQLDEAGVEALAKGLYQGLSGETKIEDFSDETIQEAVSNVELRLEAIDNGADELPEVAEQDLNIIGFVMLMQSGLIQLEFGAEDADLISKGFIAGGHATGLSEDHQAKMPAFQKFIQKRLVKAQTKAAAEEAAFRAERQVAIDLFFEKLSADPMVQKSKSGLYYKILEPGAEEKPTLEDTVKVHYKGTLINGKEFDSSYSRGRPADFPLNGVVKGFGEGLTKIGVGGKIILYMPSELGYGETPRPGGPIRPGDALVFECELIEVNP